MNMKKICYTLLLIIFYLAALREAHAQTYTWNQVRIGGSGALPSFVAHPKVPDLYFITTDVGTPYRWNKNLQKWEHLMLFQKIPVNYWNWEFSQRCGSLGVDPSDATGNILYATVENSAGSAPGKGSSAVGTILKSTDRGDSWTDLHVPIVVHPNSTQLYGERIQVDPANSNVVWVVTDQDGAWKTENAGTSWSQVNAVTTPGACAFILFDKSSGTVDVNGQQVTRRIYIGRSAGVYASEDGGGSFTLMSNGPEYPYRATIHADGTLYVSAGTENQKKGVYKYRNGSWQDVSPVTLVPDPDPNKNDRYFSKVAVSPANSDYIIVSTRGSWQKDPYYISTRGGVPGSYTPGRISTRDNSEAPHSKNDGVPFDDPGHNSYGFTWDPFYPDRVWINDMLDILSTDNIFASSSDWKIRVVGLEEIMVTGPLVAPPSGKNQLFTVTADVGGAHHRSLTEPLKEGAVSSTALFTNIFSAFNMTGVGFQYTNPDFVVRVGCDGPSTTDLSASRAGYSTDGGDSYTLFPKSPGIRGRVAVSADRRNILWLTQMDGNSPGNVYWSEDLGSSWTKSTGLASGILPAGPQWMLYPGQNHLAADKVNGDYFYVWDRGSFFVSSDGGKSFVKTAAEGLAANAGSNPNGSSYATASNVEVTPGKTGDVWIAYHNEGQPQYSALYHTTDTGKTFTKVGGDNFKPKWIAVAMSDTTPNAHLVLFVTSQAIPINGITYGAFRSDDTARTWTTILDRLPGVAPNITADNKGRMFISAHGNGIFFGSPVAGPVQSVEIINPASDTIVKGYAVKLNVKLTPTYPNNPAVTWSSSDTTIAKVDAFGKVSGMNAGTATITVTSVEGGKTGTRQIVVIPPTISSGITIDSVVYGTMNTPKQIAVTVIPSNTTNKTLNWSVADNTIASVDANGVVTGLKLGVTTLTIAAADGGFTKSVQLIVSTTVIAINAGTTASPATPYQNTAIGQYVPEGPGGTDKLWHAGYTGSTRITATVDLSQVTSPAPRQVYEYMRVSRYNVTQLRYYFRNLIPNANYSLRLHFIEPSDADKANRIFKVKTGGDSLINFNIYQAAGNKLNTVITRTLEAKADNTGIITVNFIPNGVTNGPYSAAIAALEANIIPLQGINVHSDSSNLYVSYKDTLKLTTTPANATNRNLVYKSSNDAIATVDLNGIVTGKAAGTVTITATSVESSFTATKTYTVIYVPVTALTLDSSSANVFVGSTFQLNAAIQPVKASNKGVVWTSSDTTVAKVSNNGTISGIKQGDVIITASSADNPAIAAQANIHVANVLATSLVLQPSPAVIGERDTLRVNVSFLPANTSIKKVSWSSGNATLATVDSTGLITAIKQGNLTITVNTQDGSGVSATLPVTVVPFDSCGGIPNYGFESGLINWVAYKDTVPTPGAVYTVSGKGHSGDKAATMGFTTAKTSLNIKGSIPVRGGSVIVFTQWVKVEKDASGYPWWAGYGVGFIDSLGASVGNAAYAKDIYNVAAYKDNWAQIRDTINVPDSATGLTYWVAKIGFGTVWVDDYCIEVLKTNQSAIYGINAGTTLTPPGPYANTTFAQYVPEGPTGTDKLWHAGYTWVQKVNAPVDLSHVADPAPPQVYEYIRVFKDNITQMRYYLRGLTPNTVYTIRLHFVEPLDAQKNNRIFSIKATNGLDSLMDFNIYQAAGNKLNTAVIKTIRAKADNAGLIMVFFYPKKGLYDPYSGSVAAIEVRTLQPGDTLQSMTANQSMIAVAGSKLNTHGDLDFKTVLYPNPSNDVFNVRMTSSSKAPALLTIVNNAGSIIYSTRINAGAYYQLGQDLKPGIYYINIKQGTRSKTMKVVKQ